MVNLLWFKTGEGLNENPTWSYPSSGRSAAVRPPPHPISRQHLRAPGIRRRTFRPLSQRWGTGGRQSHGCEDLRRERGEGAWGVATAGRGVAAMKTACRHSPFEEKGRWCLCGLLPHHQFSFSNCLLVSFFIKKNCFVYECCREALIDWAVLFFI